MSGSGQDLVIIGGGVQGLSSALELQDVAVTDRVTLLERGETGREASWAGAGIVPPGNPSGQLHPSERLRAFSSSLFPDLSRSLAEFTGIDNGFIRCGGIEFLSSRDDFDAWQVEGIAFEELTPNELSRLESIHPPDSTVIPVRVPDMAQVRNPWHVRALREACLRRGVDIQTHSEVVGFTTRGDRVVAIQLGDGRSLSADQFLITAGAWTRKLLTGLGWQPDPGMIPVRGQIVLFRSPRPPIRHILLHGKCYLVPRPDGRTLVGSTEEPEAGFTKGNTPEAVADLTALAQHWVPALREAEIETTWSGLRPGSPDGLPFIGRVPGYRNLWINAGHFRAGIQLSPGSARLITDLILDRDPCVDPWPYRPERVPDRARRPAFRS